MARPRKYIRVGNREIVGVSRKADYGRLYFIDRSGRRAYYPTVEAARAAYRALHEGPLSEEDVAQVQAATAARYKLARDRLEAGQEPSRVPALGTAARIKHRIIVCQGPSPDGVPRELGQDFLVRSSCAESAEDFHGRPHRRAIMVRRCGRSRGGRRDIVSRRRGRHPRTRGRRVALLRARGLPDFTLPQERLEAVGLPLPMLKRVGEPAQCAGVLPVRDFTSRRFLFPHTQFLNQCCQFARFRCRMAPASVGPCTLPSASVQLRLAPIESFLTTVHLRPERLQFPLLPLDLVPDGLELLDLVAQLTGLLLDSPPLRGQLRVAFAQRHRDLLTLPHEGSLLGGQGRGPLVQFVAKARAAFNLPAELPSGFLAQPLRRTLPVAQLRLAGGQRLLPFVDGVSFRGGRLHIARNLRRKLVQLALARVEGLLLTRRGRQVIVQFALLGQNTLKPSPDLFFRGGKLPLPPIANRGTALHVGALPHELLVESLAAVTFRGKVGDAIVPPLRPGGRRCLAPASFVRANHLRPDAPLQRASAIRQRGLQRPLSIQERGLAGPQIRLPRPQILQPPVYPTLPLVKGMIGLQAGLSTRVQFLSVRRQLLIQQLQPGGLHHVGLPGAEVFGGRLDVQPGPSLSTAVPRLRPVFEVGSDRIIGPRTGANSSQIGLPVPGPTLYHRSNRHRSRPIRTRTADADTPRHANGSFLYP